MEDKIVRKRKKRYGWLLPTQLGKKWCTILLLALAASDKKLLEDSYGKPEAEAYNNIFLHVCP